MLTKRAERACHIRWLIRRDIPDVLRADAASFGPKWSYDDFLRHLRRREIIGMSAETNDKVVGYMLYELRKRSLRLLRLAVSPEHCGMGVGRQLITRLVAKLTSHRRGRLLVPVEERNVAAQLFLRACGLRCEKIRGDRYLFVLRAAEPVCTWQEG